MANMSSTDRNTPVSMVARVDAILSEFQRRGPLLTPADICRATGLPKASVSRIVAELLEHGILERSGKQLRLGIRLFELGVMAVGPRDLTRLAAQHMAHLRAATKQTVHLATLDGSEVVYVQILRSSTAPRLPSRVGGRLPAYATGVGKALLALLPDEELEDALPDELDKLGPNTITSRDELHAELARIRADGIAFENRESSADLGCAAAAIVGFDNRPFAAISITVHMGSVPLDTLGPAVSTAAQTISADAKRFRISG